jgi:hypothetical protein
MDFIGIAKLLANRDSAWLAHVLPPDMTSRKTGQAPETIPSFSE